MAPSYYVSSIQALRRCVIFIMGRTRMAAGQLWMTLCNAFHIISLWVERRLEAHGRRTCFKVSHSISDMHQSAVSKFLLELLNDNGFSVITTRRLLFVKSNVFTCSALSPNLISILLCLLIYWFIILHSLWGSWKDFSFISPSNLNGSGWKLEVRGNGAHTHTHTKFRRNCPRGCTSGCQNVFRFFVTNTTRTFGHLSCTDFDCIWNNRSESACACIYRYTEFLCRGFYRS